MKRKEVSWAVFFNIRAQMEESLLGKWNYFLRGGGLECDPVQGICLKE
ncbi:hypothetical protein [Bartonella sp. CB74]